MALQVPTWPNVCFYTTCGKQNKQNMHWDEQQTSTSLEIRSHKNLMTATAVWANEVHCLLTYCSASCYQMRHWWHVRVSAVQRTSASARETIELLECETSDFISPTALTSFRSSLQAMGCHATAGLSDDIQECGRTQEATGWNLDWSGAEHYWHCYQCMEKPSACLCSREGRHFKHLLQAVEQWDIWINCQPEWLKCKPNVIYPCYFNKVIKLPCIKCNISLVIMFWFPQVV